MKDVRELLTVNSTSLSMVCSVFKKRTEETGQMLDKWRGDRPKSCLQLKGTSLRISKNTKRREMELRDASGPWVNPINDYQKMISVEGDCQGLTEWQKRERCSGGGSVMARAAFLSVVLTILLKLMNYQHRKVLPNFNPPCNTRWKASAMIPNTPARAVKAQLDRKTPQDQWSSVGHPTENRTKGWNRRRVQAV